MSGEGSSSQDIDHYPGQYEFTVHPGLQDDDHQPRKNVEFTFSTKLNRLFVKRQAVCPFGIFTSAAPPANSEIKIHVYSEDQVPVMRCHAHTEGNEHEDFISPLHYMRCHNQSAIYHCCDETGQLSILLPYIKPECVPENVENFVFLCSSKHCINKELFIKFSLINREKIIGYQVFGLHVCSTPGRDRLNHEVGKTKARKRKNPSGTGVSPSVESQTYQVLTKKQWICDYIVRINRGLELLEAVPQEEQEMYLRHRAKQATSSQTVSTCTATSSSDTRSTLRRILVKS